MLSSSFRFHIISMAFHVLGDTGGGAGIDRGTVYADGGHGRGMVYRFFRGGGGGERPTSLPIFGRFFGKNQRGSVEALEVVRSGAECRGVEADRRRGGRFRLEECHVFMIKSTATAGIITKSPPFWR